jgi:glycosyltransferase involved in cell wall biosynthesis
MMSRDHDYISHGLHMTYELLQHGRVAPYVPLGIAASFRHEGEDKEMGTVAVMPRKGSDALTAVGDVLRNGERLVPIDGMPEAQVAATLKRADVFLAISPDEAFGLPPLEAMAAGCCVVGYSGRGGFEFMRHGETAWVVPNGDTESLPLALRRVLDDPPRKEQLRRDGQRVAGYYTMEREREYLQRAFEMLDAW